MTTTLEAPKEIRAGLCHTDFEVGDRFYSVRKDANIYMGTVLSSKETALSVLWDDGTEDTFEAPSARELVWLLKNCGSPLDLTQLEVGSIISRFLGGKRVFLQVTNYVPGKEVEAAFIGRDDKPPLIKRASEKHSLEKLMSLWELEG